MKSDKPPRIEALERLLADSYTLYLKTQSYHWNVKGPMFSTLHSLFETEYTDLAAAVDEIAERIRALGAQSPGSFAQFRELAKVKEDRGAPIAMEMIRKLVDDQKIVADSARKLVEIAQAAGDEASADLAIRRIQIHEKNAWMLKSHLE
jgi:starvation-inducible DNA-binding protein